MFCTNCGIKIPNGVTFCSQCGTKMMTTQQDSYAQPQATYPTTTQTSVKSNNKVIIGIIVALFMCILIILLFFVFNNRESNAAHEAYYQFIEDLKPNLSDDNFDFTTVGLMGRLVFSAETNLQRMGYAFLDIDNNGIDELIIGNVSGSGSYTGYMLGLYTYKDGEIVYIINAEEREQVYLLNDFTFYTDGSNSYNHSTSEVYKLENTNLVQLEAYIFKSIDENVADNSTWFEVTFVDGEYDYDQLRQLSEQEVELYYQVRKNEYDINYIPFLV